MKENNLYNGSVALGYGTDLIFHWEVHYHELDSSTILIRTILLDNSKKDKILDVVLPIKAWEKMWQSMKSVEEMTDNLRS